MKHDESKSRRVPREGRQPSFAKTMILCLAALAVGGATMLGLILGKRISRVVELVEPPRVVVLGVDAMDYGITRKLIDEGKLPNLASLAGTGTFMPLRTSMPPLSPVAWTNFTTGMDPGGHGVFDFLRRDPDRVGPDFLPEDAVSKVATDPDSRPWSIPFTPYVLPPRQHHKLLRKGRPFWEILESNGIDTVVYKMPANFPASPTDGRTLAGMGTPDIEGTYGTFTYITDDSSEWSKVVAGGRILKATAQDGSVRIIGEDGDTTLPYLCGPVNPFLSGEIPLEERRAKVPFQIYVDQAQKAAAICVQGCDTVINEGEWSSWVNVEFELFPRLSSIRGIVRFYLKAAGPSFRLFVCPVNLAPGSDGLGTRGFDLELLRALGPYYTKGMAEQTKALTQGILSPAEYVVQSEMVLKERVDALDYLISRFTSGLLFFYISTLDLDSHVMWKYQDPQHPSYDREEGGIYGSHIEKMYARMDEVVGRVRSRLREHDILYVISDHGFVPFRQEVNLPSWLHREGYLVYESPITSRLSKLYSHIDWKRTRVYPVGFNSLYVNLEGREASGCVRPQEHERLAEEVRDKLLSLRDADGQPVFRSVYRPQEIYNGPQTSNGPDLVLGYAEGFGPSDESVLGTWSEDVIAPHGTGFSGHHAVDYEIVPGVFFRSKELPAKGARLEDVTVTVLNDFGVPPDPQMTGKSLY